MSKMEIEQVVSDGIRNVVILKVTDNSGRTMYANLKAWNNLFTAQDQARTEIRNY